MVTSPDIPTIFSSKRSTPKVDKAVKKIQKLKATPKPINSPIRPKSIPRGTTTIQSTSTENLHVHNTSCEIVPVGNMQMGIPEQATTMIQQPTIAQEHERN